MKHLYKRDSHGKIRKWSVYTVDNVVYVAHGVDGGAVQVKTTECLGKNIGKSNETSPEEQAKLEAESKYNKQLDKGYSPDLSFKAFRPMLAHDFTKHGHKLKFPAIAQPKLDGIRCNILLQNDKIVAQSRNGKEFKTLTHITDDSEIVEFFYHNPDVVLDGEIYNHSKSFQAIISAVKRDKPVVETADIQYHIYDCSLNLPFGKRLDLILNYFMDNTYVKHTKFQQVQKQSDIDFYLSQYTELGYEGLILRNIDGKYKINGRSYDLLKYKKFLEQECEIIGLKEDKNNECVFTCVCPAGEFDVKCRGTHEERQEMLDLNNIGKLLTVRYFELTDKNIPRFPVGIAIRDYE